MAEQIIPEGNRLTSDTAAALQRAGAPDDEIGRRILESLSGGGAPQRRSALADAMDWLCAHGHAADAEEIIGLGRRVVQAIEGPGGAGNGVMEVLFDWCHQELGPGHLETLLMARELGDLGNDDTDWDTAQRWYLRMVEDPDQDEAAAGDPERRELASHALRELTALAMRREAYDEAWDYAQRDLKLFENAGGTSPADLAFRLGNLADVAEQAGRTEEAGEFRDRQKNLLE